MMKEFYYPLFDIASLKEVQLSIGLVSELRFKYKLLLLPITENVQNANIAELGYWDYRSLNC